MLKGLNGRICIEYFDVVFKGELIEIFNQQIRDY
jgi:hypothetical protein